MPREKTSEIYHHAGRSLAGEYPNDADGEAATLALMRLGLHATSGGRDMLFDAFAAGDGVLVRMTKEVAASVVQLLDELLRQCAPFPHIGN